MHNTCTVHWRLCTPVPTGVKAVLQGTAIAPKGYEIGVFKPLSPHFCQEKNTTLQSIRQGHPSAPTAWLTQDNAAVENTPSPVAIQSLSGSRCCNYVRPSFSHEGGREEPSQTTKAAGQHSSSLGRNPLVRWLSSGLNI